MVIFHRPEGTAQTLKCWSGLTCFSQKYAEYAESARTQAEVCAETDSGERLAVANVFDIPFQVQRSTVLQLASIEFDKLAATTLFSSIFKQLEVQIFRDGCSFRI